MLPTRSCGQAHKLVKFNGIEDCGIEEHLELYEDCVEWSSIDNYLKVYIKNIHEFGWEPCTNMVSSFIIIHQWIPFGLINITKENKNYATRKKIIY